MKNGNVESDNDESDNDNDDNDDDNHKTTINKNPTAVLLSFNFWVDSKLTINKVCSYNGNTKNDNNSNDKNNINNKHKTTF